MGLSRSLKRFRSWNGRGNGNGKRKNPVRLNKVLFEPLEPRLLLSADLSQVEGGLRGDFFSKVQEALNSSVFDEAIPLLGDQLSREAPGQIADSIFDKLEGFEFADDVKIADVTGELKAHLGNMIKDDRIDVTGADGDSEIRFQMTLSGAVHAELDLDLGLPADADILLEPLLGIKDVVDLDLNWSYEFDFRVKEDSFFIDTSLLNEWQVNIEATLDDNFEGYGRLGLFTAKMTEDPYQVETYHSRDMAGSWFVGNYLVDLQDQDGDNLLANSESPALYAWLTGEGAVNFHVDAAFVPDWLLSESERSDVMNLRITTDASISYTFDNANTQSVPFGDPIEMNFNNIELDTTEFLGGTFKPVIEFLKPYFERAKPVFDFMNEEVPVISDLNKWIADEPLTVLDLARTVLAGLAAGTEHDKLALAIERVTEAINVVNAIVTGDPNPQQSAPESMGAYTVVIEKNEISGERYVYDSETSVTTKIWEKGNRLFRETSGDLSFPILEDTSNLFDLMRGDTGVRLWNFDLSGSLGFEFSFEYPIPFIPVIKIEGTWGFQFDRKVGAGSDTLGVKLFGEALDWGSDLAALQASARENKDLIKKGFYFDDHNPDQAKDNSSSDEPEIWLGTSLSAGPALGYDFKIGKLKLGANAKLDAGIFFDLNDLPNPLPEWSDPLNYPREGYPADPDDFTYDGRIRWDEMETIRDSHPWAIFNSGGKLSASLSAYAEAKIGKGWFKVTLFNKSWSLGSWELLKFDFGGPTDDEILSGLVFAKASLGEMSVGGNGELGLYMGPTAKYRVAEGSGGGNSNTDVGEEITIKSLGWTDPGDPSLGETVEIEFEGWQQEFEYVKSITANGGEGDDRIVVLPGVEADVTLYGGNGNDTLDYRGKGTAVLFGQEGDDHLFGGEEDDLLDGGEGDDEIEGSEGDDDLHGGAGNDILRGSAGNDELWGELGDDFMDGGSGDDVLIGGAGDDQYAWEVGSGADTFVENIDGGDDGITIGGGTEIVGSGGDGRNYVTEEIGDLVTLSKIDDMVLIEGGDCSIYLADFESLSVSAGGGPDTVIVNDLTGTDIKRLAIDLSQAGGEAADATGDTVIFNGSSADDFIMVEGALEELPLTDLETGEIETVEREVIKIHDTTGGGDRTAYILNSDPETDRLEVIGFEGNDHLSVGAGSDNVDVHALIKVILDGGEGDDVLSTTYANTEARGGVGSDLLVVSDGNFSEAQLEVLLDEGSVEVRSNGETESLLMYQDVEKFQINLGSAEFGTDLCVRGDITIPVEINGGSQRDTLIGPDGTNIWEILGPNTGRLNRIFISFNEVRNLTGGSGDDTFYFRGPGSVSGIVDGGAGFDILDFLQSDFIQEAAQDFLKVHLPIGDEVVDFTATGGITRIEDILVIMLAEVLPDGTLLLNMGPRAAERLTVNTEDGDEIFLLSHVTGNPADAAGETIRVSAFGFDLEYEGVRSIRGSGGQGNDQIILGSDVLSPAELDGGPGNDILTGGAGDDVLLGDYGVITRAANGDGTTRRDVLLTDLGTITKAYDLNDFSCRTLNSALVSELLNADLVLLGGAYNADGTRHYARQTWFEKEWETQLLLVTFFADGNDVLSGAGGKDALFGGRGDDRLTGGTGDDSLVGNAGNDFLEGNDGNDILVGDDAVNIVSGGTMPRVLHGLCLLPGDGQVGGIVLGDAGTAIVPILSMLPGQGLDTLQGTLAEAAGNFGILPGENALARKDGTYLLPLVSIVTDVAHHLDLLSGNDRISGGAGDDQLVGDDRVVFSPAVTFTAGTLNSASRAAGDLLAATADLGEFVHRLHIAVDRCEPPYGHGDSSRAVLDRTFYLGNDELDAGAGNDFLVGDNLTVMSPSLGVPANRADEFHRLVHDLNEAGDRAQSALGELDEAAHDSRDTWVSMQQGKRTYRILEHHYDRIVFGNDSLAGGDGNEVMAGDNWSFLTPQITAIPANQYSGSEYPGWGWGQILHPHWWNDGWHRHGYDRDGWADEWVGGNDALTGGEGNDLLFGDSAAFLAPAMTLDPSIGYWDSLVLRAEVREILGDLVAAGRYEPFAPGWFDHHELHNGQAGVKHGVSGGNDILRGGNGDDILFGQGGNDFLFGDAGNDWLVGGDGDDTLEKGTGRDKVRYGNDSSRELWERVQSYLVDLADRFDDMPDLANGTFPRGKMTPCTQWVKDFVIDLGARNVTRDPNGEIKIMLT